MNIPPNQVTAGAKHLPPLLENDVSCLKNKIVADVILPGVFRAVLDWGCKKDDTQSYLEYLQKKYPPPKWRKYSKRWTDDELNFKLNATESSCFDVTFLFKLIPEVCSDIEPCGSKAYFECSDTKVEAFMQRAKSFRNDDAHFSAGSGELLINLSQVEDVIGKLLSLAGTKFGIDSTTVQKEIDDMAIQISTIEQTAITEKQTKLKNTRQQISENGKKELEAMVQGQAIEKMPFSNIDIPRTEIFHPTKLFIEIEANKQETIEISCEELLSPLHHNIVMSGHPGSGKSTLLRRLQEDYVSNKPKTFDDLQKFMFLLPMECRDQTVETIPHLLKKKFPKTFEGIDEEYAVEALKGLSKLILIDGIDEVNDSSRNLLDEVIDEFGAHDETTLIFASRPGSSDILVRTLRSKGVSFSSATIQPITSEKEQIEYITRYQAYVPGINALEMINAFKALDDPCKNCMIYPMNLSFYCHLYRRSPEAVSKWKNELSITRQILQLSSDLIKERLCVLGVSDEKEQNHLASKLLSFLRDCAVCQLLKGTQTLDQKGYTDICRHCFDDLDVSYYAVLSCVLQGHSDHMSFEYVHKSFAEFLAATAIFTQINSQHKSSVLTIIPQIVQQYKTTIQCGNTFRGAVCSTPPPGHTVIGSSSVQLTTEEACRYGNTFRFLLMMLWEAGPEKEDLFNGCLLNVCQSLTDGGMPFSYWAELYLSLPTSRDVLEAAAKAAEAVAKEGPNLQWILRNSRDMRAAAAMLPLRQPPALDVFTALETDAISSLPALMKNVAEQHTGVIDLYLGHSMKSFTAVDHLLTCKMNSCYTLRTFAGCVGGDTKAWLILNASLGRSLQAGMTVSVFISLLNPRRHQLHFLADTKSVLGVRVVLSSSSCDRRRRPLPMSTARPPYLSVCCQDGVAGVAAVAALFEDLAPENKLYYGLFLQQWRGSDCQLDQLVVCLSKAGLRTPGNGKSLWMHSGSTSDGRCSTCGEKHHQPGERCVQLVLSESTQRAEENLLVLNSESEMTEVTAQLEDRCFPWLRVLPYNAGKVMPRGLEPLVKAIALRHNGTLDLCLKHSYYSFIAVDEYVAILQSAQCPLVVFSGCLNGDSETAWQSLTAAFLRAEQSGLEQDIRVSLMKPRQHMLDPLGGSQHTLSVRIRLSLIPNTRCRRPLPLSATRPPVLLLDFTPPEGGLWLTDEPAMKQTIALVEDLAPQHKEYYSVILCHWPGTDKALDKLVTSLHDIGLKTRGNGIPNWNFAATFPNKMCGMCMRLKHRPGTRCIMLWMPKN